MSTRGIPKNLPIDSIRPFTPPIDEEKQLTPSPEFPELSPDGVDMPGIVGIREEDEDIESSPVEVDIALPNIATQRKEILLRCR